LRFVVRLCCNCGCDAAMKSFKKLFIAVAAFAVADRNLKLWK
jgi:hypothetical protein